MTISELARRAGGCTLRTIRFYEERGLLIPSRVTPSGRRRYSSDALVVLRRIRMLKETGMTLDEIVFTLRALGKTRTAAKSRQRAHEKVLATARDRLRARMSELHELVRAVDNTLSLSPQCSGCGADNCRDCSVLETWMSLGFEKPEGEDK